MAYANIVVPLIALFSISSTPALAARRSKDAVASTDGFAVEGKVAETTHAAQDPRRLAFAMPGPPLRVPEGGNPRPHDANPPMRPSPGRPVTNPNLRPHDANPSGLLNPMAPLRVNPQSLKGFSWPMPEPRPMPKPMPWSTPPMQRPDSIFAGISSQKEMTNAEFWNYLLAGDSVRVAYPERENWEDADSALAATRSVMQSLRVLHGKLQEADARTGQLGAQLSTVENTMSNLQAVKVELVEAKNTFRREIYEHSVAQKQAFVYEHALTNIARQADGEQPAIKAILDGQLDEVSLEQFHQEVKEEEGEIFQEVPNLIALLESARDRMSKLESDMARSLSSLQQADTKLKSALELSMECDGCGAAEVSLALHDWRSAEDSPFAKNTDIRLRKGIDDEQRADAMADADAHADPPGRLGFAMKLPGFAMNLGGNPRPHDANPLQQKPGTSPSSPMRPPDANPSGLKNPLAPKIPQRVDPKATPQTGMKGFPMPGPHPMPAPMPFSTPPMQRPVLSLDDEPQDMTNKEFWDYLLAGDSILSEFPEKKNWAQADVLLAGAKGAIKSLQPIEEQLQQGIQKGGDRAAQFETQLTLVQNAMENLLTGQMELAQAKKKFRELIFEHSSAQKTMFVYQQALMNLARQATDTRKDNAIKNILDGNLEKKNLGTFLEAMKDEDGDMFQEAPDIVALFDESQDKVSKLEADMAHSLSALQTAQVSLREAVVEASPSRLLKKGYFDTVTLKRLTDASQDSGSDPDDSEEPPSRRLGFSMQLPGNLRPLDANPPMRPPGRKPAANPKLRPSDANPSGLKNPLAPQRVNPQAQPTSSWPMPGPRPMPMPMPWPKPPSFERAKLPGVSYVDGNYAISGGPEMTNKEFWDYLLAGGSILHGFPEAENWQEADGWLSAAQGIKTKLQETHTLLDNGWNLLLAKLPVVEDAAMHSHESQHLEAARARIAKIEEQIAGVQVAIETLDLVLEDLVQLKATLRTQIFEHSSTQKQMFVFEQALINMAFQTRKINPRGAPKIIDGDLSDKSVLAFIEGLPADSKWRKEAEETARLLVPGQTRLSQLEAAMSENLSSLQATEMKVQDAVERALAREHLATHLVISEEQTVQ